MSVHPSGRMALTLVFGGPDSAAYRCELSSTTGVWTADIDVTESGEVVVGSWDRGDVPGWLVDRVCAVLRAAHRAHRSKDRAPWPRTIRRWRAAPERSS